MQFTANTQQQALNPQPQVPATRTFATRTPTLKSDPFEAIPQPLSLDSKPVFDKYANADGKANREALIKICGELFSVGDAEQRVDTIFSLAKVDKTGVLTFEQFATQVNPKQCHEYNEEFDFDAAMSQTICRKKGRNTGNFDQEDEEKDSVDLFAQAKQ